MKKFLLAFGVMATALTAFAANEYGCSPQDGSTLNVATEYSGGISSIEINVDNAVINRNCTQLATLSKGGVVIKAIPANNVRMVYTFEGFDRTEVGTPHITFYSAANSPATLSGNYTVTIPSNFFTVNGKPNKRLEYNFTVVGVGIKPTLVPADGSSIPELSTIQISIPNATRIACDSGINIEYTDPDNDEKTITVEPKSITVDEDSKIITVTFEPYSTPGQVYVNISAGCIRYQLAGVSGTQKNSEQLVRYFIAPAMDNGFALTPAPGTIESLKPYKTENLTIQGSGYSYDVERSYYFDLKLPEGYTCGAPNSRKTCLYKEEADGSLKATNKFFNNWTPNEEKDQYTLWLNDQSEIKLTPGKYYLVIPGSSFYMYSPDAVSASPYTKELKFGPWIVEGETPTYTITPSGKEVLSELSEIKITFEEGSEVSVKKTGWFTILETEGEGEIEYDMRGTAEGNVVTINISPALTTPGTYDFISEASNIVVNGMEIPVSAKYTLEKHFITELNLVCGDTPVEGKIVNDPDYGNVWEVVVTIPEDQETASITFEPPFGYNEVYVCDYVVSNDDLKSIKRVPADQLIASGYHLLPDNTLSGLTAGTHNLGFTYAKDGDALVPSMMQLIVEGEPTGVNEVVVAEDAEYYTLQGVKVVNPEKGIYIKVVNGKAVKVNI